MKRKHIITIAGKLGSGKSSTARMVAEMLGYKHYSTGDFMRQMAEERGMSLMELSAIAEKDNSIDYKIDDYSKKLGESENIVLDSRLGFHFIPQSFKVFLELDPATASERILKDKESNPDRHTESSSGFNTKEDIMKNIEMRLESERKRYKELYGIDDHTNPSNFDLVINTREIPLEEVSKKVIEEYNKWLNN